MKSFLVGLIAGVSMALAASSAMAAPSVTIDTTPDFDALAAYSTTNPGGTLLATTFSASDAGVVRTPFEGSDHEDATFFAAGPLGVTQPNPATLTFASVMTDFSFLWGSPDDYNVIAFYNGDDPVGTLADFLGAAVPGIYTRAGAVFISITDLVFTRVEFYSNGQQALEFASLSAIPVPAGLPLLGAGVALLGYLGMRRKRNAATA